MLLRREEAEEEERKKKKKKKKQDVSVMVRLMQAVLVVAASLSKHAPCRHGFLYVY